MVHTHGKVEQEKNAVEYHLDHVGRVRQLFHLLDVRRLDRADRFVGLSLSVKKKRCTLSVCLLRGCYEGERT